ncbi:MAG: hypothetical protein ACOCV4_03685 [Myxococcota bacterium]
MSPPPVPGPVPAIATHFRLHWTRLVRGRKLRLGLIAVTLVLLVAWAARYLNEDAVPAEVMQDVTGGGFFTLLVFLVPFLMHAGSIAEEVEGRTFGYLAGRPAGRLAIALGKYLAGTAMTLMLLIGGLLLAHVGIFLTEPSALVDELGPTLQSAGALTLLALYYGGLCQFWGAVAPEAAGIVATLHLAVLEFVFTWAPGIVRLVSMNHMARTLADIPLGGLMVEHVPPVAAPAAVGVLALATVVAVTLSTIVVQATEYRHGGA